MLILFFSCFNKTRHSSKKVSEWYWAVELVLQLKLAVAPLSEKIPRRDSRLFWNHRQTFELQQNCQFHIILFKSCFNQHENNCTICNIRVHCIINCMLHVCHTCKIYLKYMLYIKHLVATHLLLKCMIRYMRNVYFVHRTCIRITHILLAHTFFHDIFLTCGHPDLE